MSAELVEHLFLPAFGPVGELRDSAVVDVGTARVAFSTDSYVVRPLFFPGGSIGDLAVNGTVNDLAMSGAQPLYLSTAFILEEGTALADLGRVAEALGAAARAAGVRLVTGDTKVVDAGHGDGVYVNTAGIGLVGPGVDIRPGRARPGDVVLVSGDIGRHGVAVLSCREGLEFGTAVESDTAPLHGLVAAMLDTGADVHVLRDPTRGGLAASLNEIATTAGVGVELVERELPVPPEVADACALLGLDPLYVANEGRLVAVRAGRRRGPGAGRDARPPARRRCRGHRSGHGGAPRRWWWRARGSGRREWWTCRWVSSCPGSADPDGARPGQPRAPVVTAARVATVVAQAFMRQEL